MDKVCPAFIVSTFREACSIPAFQGKWMTADTWSEVIVKHYKLSDVISFNGNQLVSALGLKINHAFNSEISVADRRNLPHDHVGIFRDVFRPKGGKRVHCFYAGPRGKAPEATETAWYNYINDGKELLEKVITRQEIKKLSNETINLVGSQLVNPSPRKRKRPQTQEYDKKMPSSQEGFDEKKDSSGLALSSLAQDSMLSPPSYWSSKEARNIFLPIGDELDALEAIKNQIESLKDALSGPRDYLTIVDVPGSEEASAEMLSEYQSWIIIGKCQLLLSALIIASTKMPLYQNWDKICQEAIDITKKYGVPQTKNSRTLRNWYMKFREKRKIQINQASAKDNLPPFLMENKEICTSLQQYAREHLSELSVELICEYLHGTVIPKMVKETSGVEKSVNEQLYTEEAKKILKQYGLTCIDPSTVYRWMQKLGFKYEPRRKGYYVDGHEKPATIEYRKQFVTRYLAYEQRAHRWIQIPLSEALELEDKKMIPKNSGYRYEDDHGESMVELHIDSCQIFEEKANKETKFGGWLSVRKAEEEKPLIMFGHDECIFKQFHTTNKSWKAPNGETVLIPKDDGQGVMISGFQCREFGFGMPLTKNELTLVNTYRANTKYADEKAAISLRGTADKQPLKETPFVREFEYGANNEGYWSYEHMVLQMEDCLDVMRVLYPQYEVLLLFDHSCGHDRQREDGLNVENMSKSYGGKQRIIRPSLIKEENGYLGRFNRKLQRGDTQNFVFSANDDGPFWMNESEREEKRHDRVIEGQFTKKKLSKDELIQRLQEKGVTATGNIKNITRLCQVADIPIEILIPKTLQGWQGKPKGMLQVLWERGFIDEKNLNQYTVTGRKDEMGILQPETSLKFLLGNCLDFEEEESLLQSKGRILGAKIDRTPKCHCELAGEGIEYSWGCAKNFFRQQPLKDKRKKENFRNTVRKCMSEDTLSRERVRKFSRRARQYILAYQALHSLEENEEQQPSTTSGDAHQITPMKIESLVKDFKTHRCALDFDKGFIKTVITKKEG